MKIKLLKWAAWGLLAVLSGCLSNDVVDSGRIAIRLADAPVDDVRRVVVQFSGIDVNSSNGTETITFDPPKQFELTALYNGRFDYLLDSAEIVAGNYNWLRLRIDSSEAQDSFVELNDGTMVELTVQGNDPVGHKIAVPFTVDKNENITFVVDFNLRESLRESGGAYTLVPDVRFVDLDGSGYIRGAVDSDYMALAGCDNGVYVYAFNGSDAEPTDVSGDEFDPVAFGRVELDEVASPNNDKFYNYQLAYLPAGDYTIALTCDAELDTPTGSENLEFFTLQERNSIPYSYYNVNVEATRTDYQSIVCLSSVCAELTTQ